MLGLTDSDVMSFQELDEDWAIPCDYIDRRRATGVGPTLHETAGGGDTPAQWIMAMVCPKCGLSGQRLVCGPCKNFILQTWDSAECEAGCVVTPFRYFVVRTERLDRTA